VARKRGWRKATKTRKRAIYFAGAISGGRRDATIYRKIIALLKRHGRVLTEHIGNPRLSGRGETGSNRWIHDRDQRWLRKADWLVAEVTTPSLGVGYEIGKATEWGKPVLCLFRPGDHPRLSAMVAGSPEVQLLKYRTLADLERKLARAFSRR
jgi:nucleoside 2-deoxyribosyltransferase